MDTEPVLLYQEGHTAIITLNRPPTNAMNLQAFEGLTQKLDEIEHNKSTRVVILTGQGEKGFCAGFDLTAGSGAVRINEIAQSVCNRLESFNKPIIAAINGYALGGGCEIALSCHFRFMTNHPKAVIGLPELDLGVMPVWGGTQRLPRLIGKSKALELILLSQRINPQQALKIGLVNRVCKGEDLLSESLQFANGIAKRAPLAVSAVLNAVVIGENDGLAAGLQAELNEVAKLGSSQDAMEGIRAFFEKREPVFRGE